MIDSSYFYLALLFVLFYGWKYIRLTLQFILHFTIYSLVSLNHNISQYGKLLWVYLQETVPRYKLKRNASKSGAYKSIASSNSADIETQKLEDDVIDIWNMSIAGRITNYIIIPLSLSGVSGITILLLNYIVSNIGSSGPFNLFNSSNIVDINTISIVLQFLFVL